jgi:hypothetical protein
MTTLRAAAVRAARQLDCTVGRWLGPRRVLVDVRNAMHFAVIEPITTALEQDPRVSVYYTAERLSVVADAFAQVPEGHVITHEQAARLRWDLYLSADPWTRPGLPRCSRFANIFHGVAGKYDLDNPGHLPIGFQTFDRVLFINRDRMDRYLANGIVSPSNAVLVGYPKADRLANGGYDAGGTRRDLGLEPGRPTALYAPTWSPASSLHIAGEAIVSALADVGWNVIVKLHPLSLDAEVPRFSGGIDWRARLSAIERPRRIVHVEDRDASPLLAASDLMVTDHSTIGFEFCLLDRPLIVYDVPGLIETARINPDRVRELRSAARVVGSVDELRRAARDARECPHELSAERQRLAAAMFFEPGSATTRGVAVAYELLELPALAPAAACSAAAVRAQRATGDGQIYATRT